MQLAIDIIQKEIAQRELANKHNHLRKEEVEKEIESLKKVLVLVVITNSNPLIRVELKNQSVAVVETIRVNISRMLCQNGTKPFFCSCNGHQIKRGHEKFYTLKELKEYYNIKKLVKTGETGWAINSRGKKHVWDIYEAEISADYIIKKN